VLDVLATASHYTLDVLTAPAVPLLAYAIPGLPALVRRRAGSAGPVSGQPRHRPGGTVVPGAATEDSTRIGTFG
jgi:hypothetical protein